MSLFSKLTSSARCCLVLAVLSCVLYANTLWNGYVLDDVMMITQNRFVQQGVGGVPTLLTTSQLRGYMGDLATDKYRPLALATFAVEHSLFGNDAMPAHLLNILLFAACVVALFTFLNRLFGGQRMVLAFVAALLFLAHPVHTEVVANIKSRDELLCFLFAFLSLNAFLGYAQSGRPMQLVAGVLLLFLSILSKETVITFLGVVPLVFFAYRNEHRRRSLFITAGMAVAFVTFLVIRALIVQGSGQGETVEVRLVYNLLALAPDAATRLATEVAILGKYLQLLFVPHPLICFYGPGSIPFSTFGSWQVWVSATVYLALLSVAGYRLYRYGKDPLALGMAFYLCTISLFSNIPFFVGTAFAERFAFFASAGFCMALAWAFDKWVMRGSNDVRQLLGVKPLAVLLPVMVAYSALTFARNADWKNDATLCLGDAMKAPNDTWVQYFAGQELQQQCEAATDSVQFRQLNKESISHFEASLQAYPDNSEAHADLGVAYIREGNPQAAETHFLRALELNPVHANAATNLATLYFMDEQFDPAVRAYQRVLARDPASDIALYNTAICYGRLGKPDSAIQFFKQAIVVAPQFDGYKAYGNVAILYEQTGMMDSARKYAEITKQYFPGFHLRNP